MSKQHVAQRMEEIVQQWDAYIVSQVRELAQRHSDFARHEVQDLEMDELAQRVRIKFWKICKEKEIDYPRAYIKRIVHSEFIDMMRCRKPFFSLTLDQDGEICLGRPLLTQGQGMADPALEFEQKMEMYGFLQNLVDRVLRLPDRQRCAMVCSLQDRVSDLAQLENAFRERDFDITAVQWPAKRTEKQLLHASLSYARQKLQFIRTGVVKRSRFSN